MLESSHPRSSNFCSFEKIQDKVFDGLKLCFSGTWESFCHGRFCVVVLERTACADLLKCYCRVSIDKRQANGYDEKASRRPDNG